MAVPPGGTQRGEIEPDIESGAIEGLSGERSLGDEIGVEVGLVDAVSPVVGEAGAPVALALEVALPVPTAEVFAGVCEQPAAPASVMPRAATSANDLER